jgi:ribulose-phosphate 3-epimerase
MVTIIPAILATTETEFSTQLDKLKRAPELEGGWVHIDLMDGQFVSTTSLELDLLKNIPIPFKKEAHLMVQTPLAWVTPLIELGFKRIIIHIESEGVAEAIELMKAKNIEIGLAVNPQTPLKLVEDYLLDINVLLIMAIEPGAQGQPFISSTYDKVKEAAGMFELIAVDGGVNDQTAPLLVQSGAQKLIIGSYLQKGDIDESLEKIWEVIG